MNMSAILNDMRKAIANIPMMTHESVIVPEAPMGIMEEDAVVHESVSERIERSFELGTMRTGKVAHRKDTDTTHGAKLAGDMVYRRTIKVTTRTYASGRTEAIEEASDVEAIRYLSGADDGRVSKWADKLNPLTMFTRVVMPPNHDHEDNVIRVIDYGMVAYWAEKLLRIPCNECEGTGTNKAGDKCRKTMPLRTAWTADKLRYALAQHAKTELVKMQVKSRNVTYRAYEMGNGKLVTIGVAANEHHIMLHPNTPKMVACDACKNGHVDVGRSEVPHYEGVAAYPARMVMDACGRCDGTGVIRRTIAHMEERAPISDNHHSRSHIPREPTIRPGDIIVSNYEVARTLIESMRKMEVRRGRNVVRPFAGMDDHFAIMYQHVIRTPKSILGQPKKYQDERIPYEMRSQVRLANALEYDANIRLLKELIQAGAIADQNQDAIGAVEHESAHGFIGIPDTQ